MVRGTPISMINLAIRANLKSKILPRNNQLYLFNYIFAMAVMQYSRQY